MVSVTIGKNTAKLGLIFFILAVLGFLLMFFSVFVQTVILIPLSGLLLALGVEQATIISLISTINLVLVAIPWVFSLLSILSFTISFIVASLELLSFEGKISTFWKAIWFLIFIVGLGGVCCLYYYYSWRKRILNPRPKTFSKKSTINFRITTNPKKNIPKQTLRPRDSDSDPDLAPVIRETPEVPKKKPPKKKKKSKKSKKKPKKP